MDMHDEIEKEAYYLYEKSGCICGRDLDNWLEAEKMVFAGHTGQAAQNPPSAEEQMTVPEPAAVFEKEKVVEEVVSPKVKPAKKTTAQAKSKKEAVKKETKKTAKSTARKKRE